MTFTLDIIACNKNPGKWVIKSFAVSVFITKVQIGKNSLSLFAGLGIST